MNDNRQVTTTINGKSVTMQQWQVPLVRKLNTLITQAKWLRDNGDNEQALAVVNAMIGATNKKLGR